VLVADPEPSRLQTLLAAVTRQGLVAQAVTALDGVYDAAFSGESDVIVLNLAFGSTEVLTLLAALKQQPETAGVPVFVIGDPDAAVAERLLQTSTPCAPISTDPATLAEQIESLYQYRRAHGGPGKLVRGSFDELSVDQVLKLLSSGRKSGRLALREDAQEGYLHFERGRVVYASFDGHKGESGLRAMMGLSKADFAYDPESLLLDPPQKDHDLDRVVREFKPKPSSAGSESQPR
jgi:CheY-like chemotaxis protein